MARITVEDCLDRVNNRFALIHMVIALREIAAGHVGMIPGGAADKPADYDDNFSPEEIPQEIV